MDNAKEVPKVKPTTKAERRALQEAQRAKKAALLAGQKEKKPACEAKKQPQPPSKPPNISDLGGYARFNTDRVAKLIRKYSSDSSTIHKSFVLYANGLLSLADQLRPDSELAIGFCEAFTDLLNDFLVNSGDDYAHAFFKRLDENIRFLKQCGLLSVHLMSLASSIQSVTGALLSAGTKPDGKVVHKALERFMDSRIKHAIRDITDTLSNPLNGFVSEGCTIMLTDGLSEYMPEFASKCAQLKIRIVVCRTRKLRLQIPEQIEHIVIPMEDVHIYLSSVHCLVVGVSAVFSDGFVQVRAGIGPVLKYAKLMNPSLNVIGLCETYKFCELLHTAPECVNLNLATRKDEIDLMYDVCDDLPYLICERGVVKTINSTPITSNGLDIRDDSKDEHHEDWRLSSFPPGPYVPTHSSSS